MAKKFMDRYHNWEAVLARTGLAGYRWTLQYAIDHIDHEPLSDFEEPFRKLLCLFAENMSDNPEGLVILLDDRIDHWWKQLEGPLENMDRSTMPFFLAGTAHGVSELGDAMAQEGHVLEYVSPVERATCSLNGATLRQTAYYNAGRLYGMTEAVKHLGMYEDCFDSFIAPYLGLKKGDTVYLMVNSAIHRTTVTARKGTDIQTAYGHHWYTKYDYLTELFTEDELPEMRRKGWLDYAGDCYGCKGFRQGKCAYGYDTRPYQGYTWRNNQKIVTTKGIPRGLCCRTTGKENRVWKWN